MGFKRIAARGQETQVAVRDAVQGVRDSLPTVDTSRFKQLAARAGSAFLEGANTVIGAVDDFTQAAGEKVVEVGSKVRTAGQLAMSKPAQFIIEDVLFQGGAVPSKSGVEPTITETNFDRDHLDLLTEIARSKLSGPGSRAEIVYDDWNERGSTVDLSTGSSSKRVTAEDLVAGMGNPTNELKQILGSAKIFVDENGDMIVEDQYNFNYYYDPALDRNINAEQWSLFDNRAKLQAMHDTITSETMSTYDKIRNFAFMLGSKDFEGVDNPRDEGRKIRINLGKYDVQS